MSKINIRYPVFKVAGYPAKLQSGASLIGCTTMNLCVVVIFTFRSTTITVNNNLWKSILLNT